MKNTERAWTVVQALFFWWGNLLDFGNFADRWE